jgi:hypothetical protein
LSADVVTASDELLVASEDENPDLLWTLRGGGANFGVVTSFKYHLHKLDTVYSRAISYPLIMVKTVLQNI